MKRASEICTCSFPQGSLPTGDRLLVAGEAGPCGELRWEGRGSSLGDWLGSCLGTLRGKQRRASVPQGTAAAHAMRASSASSSTPVRMDDYHDVISFVL